MKLRISYFNDTDTLSLWNGMPASEGGDVTRDLIADYDVVGKVVGFTLEHAGHLLLNLLSIRVDYGYTKSDSFSDQYPYIVQLKNGTLTFSNAQSVEYSDEVAEHLTAHYDADGDAAGFTLDSAAELLLPYLKGEVISERLSTAAGSAVNNED